MKKYKNEKGFAHLFTVILLIAVFALIGFAGWRVTRLQVVNKTDSSGVSNKTATLKESPTPTAEIVIKEKADQTSPVATTTSKAAPKTTAPATKPKTVESTNCGSAVYNGTNTAFMDTDTYLATKKFKAALVFAGLTTAANSNKTVVFTMTDSIFDSLSPAQLAFMNASPDNMRSVLGWHIAPSCQTYAAVFRDATAPVTFQTLNGPVTYTLSGHGKVESAEIGIWDWFTTNGAVHYITGYIKPPQI